MLHPRDVLIEYGKLMKYRPQPTAAAYCYDGPLALRQFGPDPNDAADVLETYPWCACSLSGLESGLQGSDVGHIRRRPTLHRGLFVPFYSQSSGLRPIGENTDV